MRSARAADLLGLVLRSSLAIALAGTALGLGASLVSTRLLSGFLFGVGTTDPVTLTCVASIAILAALFASLAPAVQAARTDPMTSLRSD